MAQQRGATVKLVVGFEDTFGEGATTGFVMPFISETIKPNQNAVKDNTLTGSLNPTQPSRGNKDVNGNIVVPLDTRASWYWLKAMFNDPVTTGGAAAAWQATHAYEVGDMVIPTVGNGRYYEATADTGSSGATEPTWPTTVGATVADDGITWTCRAFVHEFKIPDAMPSIAIEKQMLDLDTPRYIQYKGIKISSANISVGGDGNLIMTMTVVGASFENAESTMFTSGQTEISVAKVNNFQAAVLEGGGELSTGTQLDLEWNTNLDTDTFVIGGEGVRGSINEGVWDLSGTLTTLFADDTLLEKALNGTESSLKLTITGSDVSVFELEFQEIEYNVSGPEVQGPQGIKQPLSFTPYYDDGSEASAIVARLTNIDQHAA